MVPEQGSKAVTALAAAIRQAFEHNRPLIVQGGGSKSFLGCLVTDADRLDTRSLQGIINYEPEELVIRVRAGTPLAEVERILVREGQMLAFEPPHFGGDATIGGVVSAGIAGPRRPWAGAVRDYILGAGLITGDGRVLEFGGQVMKNVAGYDVSRLITGAMGTLGVITDVSMKVLPRPGMELTLCQERGVEKAHELTISLSGQPLPVSGTCYCQGRLYVRLSGSESPVRAAAGKVGGEETDDDIWAQVANHTLPSLAPGRDPARDVWRLSVPPGSDLLLEEAAVIEWGGGQRWLVDPDFNPRDRLPANGGHATLFRAGRSPAAVFQPLPPAIKEIHRGLKAQFDPAGILNPGRMYEEF